jgi:hypothetical protein
MIDGLIKSIERTFVEFTFRRLLYVLFLLALVSGALYLFDNSTGYSFYARLDRRIEALEKLQQIESRGFKPASELDSIFNATVAELRDHSPSPIQLRIGTDPIVKFLAAALVPFVFMIIGLFKLIRKEPESPAVFAGAFAFTLILGIPGVFLQITSVFWLNALIYFLVQLVVLVVISVLGRKKPS